MSEPQSVRSTAKSLGVSHTAIQKAIKSGRLHKCIKKVNGKILLDLEMARDEWNANTDMKAKFAKVSDAPSPEELAEQARQTKTTNAYHSARSLKETYEARIKKLELDEKSGILVDAERVKKEAFKVARLTRDAILSIPDRISHQLAAESDAHKVHLMLTAELRSTLINLIKANGGSIDDG